MKIVLVTPLLDSGGGQRYVTELANYWAKTSHDITIIVLWETEIFYDISDQVKIIELNYSYTGKLSKIYSFTNIILDLRTNIKQIEPNFVLSILSSTNILTLFATLFLKRKVFVRDVMSPFRERSKSEKFLRRVLYKKASGVITMTNTAKEFIQKETGVFNIKVIPNPVKKISIDKSINKEKIVLNVGRLVSQKGQKYFLEACAELNEPEWKFVILGEGPKRKFLEKQVIELGIEDRVLLPGAVKDIDLWLNKSSIFAFSSVSEAWGIALCEAMSAGLPCVSFDCEVGPSEMINDQENGFLVDMRDIESFKSRIKELMDNATLRNKFSINAQRKCSQFTIDKISKKVLKFCSS